MRTIEYTGIDNLCHDVCAFQYNYRTISGATSLNVKNDVLQLSNIQHTGQQIFGSVSKTSLGNNKYELQKLYVIPQSKMTHTYANAIDGELLLHHKHSENNNDLYVVIPIIKSADAPSNTNSKTIELEKIINLVKGTTAEIEINNILNTIQSGYYNYTLENSSDNSSENWIIFDDDIMVDSDAMANLDQDHEPTNVSVPEQTRQILTLRYHHQGAKYLENKKVARCRPIATPQEAKQGLLADNEFDNGIFQSGVGSIKNPKSIIFISLIIFIGVVVTLLALYIFFRGRGGGGEEGTTMGKIVFYTLTMMTIVGEILIVYNSLTARNLENKGFIIGIAIGIPTFIYFSGGYENIKQEFFKKFRKYEEGYKGNAL